jgi:hypothetical protein
VRASLCQALAISVRRFINFLSGFGQKKTHSEGLCVIGKTVLPDGPTTRGAVTS